jgi:uncharacterized RDD family membrane protein YckC
MALTARAYEACPNHPEVVSGLVACARCGVAYCADCVVELEGRPYDAACKEEQVRDLRSGTAAPALASAGRRFVAMFVDGLLMLPVWFGLAMAFPITPQKEGWLMFGAARIGVPALLQLLYEAWMLASFGGQTLGKKALSIRVIRADGGAITGGQAFGRALARDLMNWTYVLGLVDALMVFSQQRRTLHDRAAGTLVVDARP